MTSVLPLLILGGVWYLLAVSGNATGTIWLLLNILDTFRALRLIRPNGRRVGFATRRRVMKEALTGWVAYVFVVRFASIPDRLFAWIPLYPILRTAVFGSFFATRIASSAAIYDSILRPIFSRYETSIDLTVLLLESAVTLVFHYFVQMPAHQILAVIISRIPTLALVHEERQERRTHLERMPGGHVAIDDSIVVDDPASDDASTLALPETRSPTLSIDPDTIVTRDKPTVVSPMPKATLPAVPSSDEPVYLGQKKTSTKSASLRRAQSSVSLVSISTTSSRQAPPPVPKKTPAPSVRSTSVNIPSVPPKTSLLDKKIDGVKMPKPSEDARPSSTRLRSVPSSLIFQPPAPSTIVPAKKTSTYAFSGGRPVTGKVDLARSSTSARLGPSTSAPAPAVVKPQRTLLRSRTEQTLSANASSRLAAKPRPRLLSRSKVGEKRLHVLQDIDEPDAKRARVNPPPPTLSN